MMEKQAGNLIWIDLEMTGLNTAQDEILEIATIVSNKDLSECLEGPSLVIHQSDEVLSAMDEWNQSHHSQSGLIDCVKNSTLDYGDAETETLAFLTQYVDANTSPMCGNSICQDRRFLARLMPRLEAFFHYRNLDVSSIGELVKRWAAKKQYHKNSSHRAMDDIRDSIKELQHYRQCFFSKHEATAER